MWNKVQIAIEQQKPKESCFQELEHNEYNKYEVKVNLLKAHYNHIWVLYVNTHGFLEAGKWALSFLPAQ